MALSDLNGRHRILLDNAVMNLSRAVDALKNDERERAYLLMVIGSATLDRVLAVIENPKDKPRNESLNGPLSTAEKRGG